MYTYISRWYLPPCPGSRSGGAARQPRTAPAAGAGGGGRPETVVDGCVGMCVHVKMRSDQPAVCLHICICTCIDEVRSTPCSTHTYTNIHICMYLAERQPRKRRLQPPAGSGPLVVAGIGVAPHAHAAERALAAQVCLLLAFVYIWMH